MESSTTRENRPRQPVRKVPQDGRRIYRRRWDAGLTQAELAALADISWQHMSSIELGRYGASPEVLNRLARALKCEVADLMPEDDE